MDQSDDRERLIRKIDQLEREITLLKSENKKLLSAVHYSPATIVVTNKNGIIEYANPGFFQITGYTEEETIGLNPKILKSGLHPREFYEDLWNTIISGNVWEGEFYNRKKNGEYYWEQAHIAPIKDDNGEITHFVAIKFDITKKIESENYLKTVISAIPELIFMMDEDCRYVDVLKSDEAQIDYVKNKYIGKSIDEMLPAKAADKLRCFISSTLETGENQIVEYELTSSEGTKWFEGRSSLLPIKRDGEKCVIVVARDITYRKHSEQNLKQINAAKDKFFTILAHDLKNPFWAILSFSELLAKNLKESGDLESFQIAKHIKNAAENTYELVENLLHWARSQTGKIEFKPRKFLVHELTLTTIQLIESQAFNKQIQISDEVPKNLLVFADLNLSRTVLRNLLSNAIKFTPNQGMVKVSAAEKEGFIEICVSDNGEGIPPVGLQKIFRIDEKYTTLGTNNEKGTGLGLILCKEFVEKQGGQIWVESEVGSGSKFFFTLPQKAVQPD